MSKLESLVQKAQGILGVKKPLLLLITLKVTVSWGLLAYSEKHKTPNYGRCFRNRCDQQKTKIQ
jgi:hypothetical protein